MHQGLYFIFLQQSEKSILRHSLCTQIYFNATLKKIAVYPTVSLNSVRHSLKIEQARDSHSYLVCVSPMSSGVVKCSGLQIILEPEVTRNCGRQIIFSDVRNGLLIIFFFTCCSHICSQDPVTWQVTPLGVQNIPTEVSEVCADVHARCIYTPQRANNLELFGNPTLFFSLFMSVNVMKTLAQYSITH